MNLSPRWLAVLEAAGHAARNRVHVGAPTAPDRELMTHADRFTMEVFELGYPNTGGEGTCAWAGSLGIFSTPAFTFGGDLEDPDGVFDTPGVPLSMLETDRGTGADALGRPLRSAHLKHLLGRRRRRQLGLRRDGAARRRLRSHAGAEVDPNRAS